MKRKLPNSSSNKQHKPDHDNSLSKEEHFLLNVKCHIFPACFGSGRLKILRNLVSRYGGSNLENLPQKSDEVIYLMFEESVDSGQVKALLDPSQFTNALFLSCRWLIECGKLKTKVDPENYEIVIKREKNETHVEPETTKLNQETSVHHASPKQDTCSTTNNRYGRDDSVNCFPARGELPSTSCIVDTQEEDTKETNTATCLELKNMSKSEAFTFDDDALKSLVKPFPQHLQEKFACARPSSSKKKDLNSHITTELEKLATTYKSKNDTWRALGYQKAISAIRNYPREISTREEALKIPGVGARLADKVAEIIESGRLRKVAEVCEGEEAETLKLFMGVWGAGPHTAQAWYTQGFRTLDDLFTKATLTRHQEIGLRLYKDLNIRIPRTEAAEIETYVRETALGLVGDLKVEVCGSYRRGKATCGDVDMLITHPDGHSHENLFRPLLSHLRQTGFLTDDLVCQEDNGNQQKYLGVCRLPGKDRLHRRLDIIVVPYAEFAPAIMYFTGSAHFNRSMRLLATKMGMSLSEHGLRVGIVRQGREKLNDGVLVDTPTEESIFTHLGLQYRPPHDRDH
ncbi:hypothetical protein Pcinc_011891 [Petrolisthes cinctipes]|uniref:DNA polymerase n=1 Tax=Petrolisthes cinctipes TaxID=88211 RepID=A0AAE1G1Y5_PETCI|nr:hypothetical protein Pcinc_011891 [Petrolisthes cinctipes]